MLLVTTVVPQMRIIFPKREYKNQLIRARDHRLLNFAGQLLFFCFIGNGMGVAYYLGLESK